MFAGGACGRAHISSTFGWYILFANPMLGDL